MTKKRHYKVYKYTSPEGKVYIGFTGTSLLERSQYGSAYKNERLFWAAIVKFGFENFSAEILEDNLTKEEASERERFYISFYRSNNKEFGYNLTAGGIGSLGLRLTIEQRNRKSIIQKEVTNRPEVRKKMSDSAKLLWGTNEGKIKKSNATKKMWQSPTYRAKIIEIRKKIWASTAHREKMRIAHNKYLNSEKGKTERENQRQRMINRWADADYKAAHTGINASMYGKKMSKESIQKRVAKTSKPCLCIETGIVYQSCAEAARQLGLKNYTHLCGVCRGERNLFAGYHWRYLTEEEIKILNKSKAANTINAAFDGAI